MAGLFPTYRGSVNLWECDQMGHMNVQFYFAKGGEATGFIRHALGLGPETIRRTGVTLMPVADRVQFRKELKAGEVVALASGIVGIDDGGVDTHGELRNSETGQLCTIFRQRLRPFDLTRRAYCDWPAEVRERAERLAAEWTDKPEDLPPQGAPCPPHDAPHLIETSRSSISTWEADENGYALPRFHILRFSNAITHLLLHLGLSNEERASRNWGLAAIDYHLHYYRPIRINEALVVRSGVVEVREKVMRVVHHLIACRGDELLTTIEFFMTLFDLTTRRAIPLPGELRQAALAFAPAGGDVARAD